MFAVVFTACLLLCSRRVCCCVHGVFAVVFTACLLLCSRRVCCCVQGVFAVVFTACLLLCSRHVCCYDHIAGCYVDIDMAFAVDVSASVGIDDVAKVMNFVKGIVARMEMASGKARVALVTYSDTATVQFHFDQFMWVALNAECRLCLAGSIVVLVRVYFFSQWRECVDSISGKL